MRFEDDEDDLDLEQPSEETHEEADEDDAAPEGQQEGDGRRADARQEGDEEERQVRKPSRAEARIQALNNENREYRDKMSRLEREMQEFKQNFQQRQQAPDPEVERRKLELMTPEERMEYRLEQSERNHQQAMQQMRFESWNSSDQAKFQAMAAGNALVAKHKDEVEAVFQDEMRKGHSFDRATIAAFVIGRAALTQGQKALKKAQDAGKKRIEGQRVAPSNPRGNVPAGRGGKSLEERLADVTF